MRACRRLVVAVALVLAGFTASAVAQTGPLPPGQVVVGPVVRGQSFPLPVGAPGRRGTSVPSITNGLEANNFLLPAIITPATLSFINSTASSAVAILTAAPTQYVRFYDPATGSGQVGNFIAPSNAVRGLTPAQIRDVLALPFQPTMQTLVRVPTGTCLLIGTAGPIAGWGNGGATQVYVIGRDRGGGCGSTALFPTFIPLDSYLQGQGIGALALVYGPRAGGGNAGAVAAALDRGPFPAQFSGMDTLYGNLDLLNYGDATQLRAALLQLAGEVHASTQTALLGDSLYLRQTVLGRMRQASARASAGPVSALGYGGPMLASADAGTPRPRDVASDFGPGLADARPPVNDEPLRDAAPETEFWLQGVAAWGQLQGIGDTAGLNRNLAGFFAGVDRRLASRWFAGLAGGYTSSSVGIGDRSSAATIGSLHVAAYTGAAFGAWDLRAGAAASFNSLATNRNINFAGFSEAESARYGATTTQLFAEAGYGIALGRLAVQPFGGFAVVHLDTDGFSENGTPGAASLTASGSSNTLGFSTLGVRAATSFELGDAMVLTPQASIGWQHAYGNTAPTSTLAFQANGATFTTTALPLARDVAIVEAGLVLHLNRQLAFQMSYFGQLAAGVQDAWLTARLSLQF